VKVRFLNNVLQPLFEGFIGYSKKCIFGITINLQAMLALKSMILEADISPSQADIALLDSSILLPAVFVIITFAVVAGIMISVQKHKH